jgi:hypothetical protein
VLTQFLAQYLAQFPGFYSQTSPTRLPALWAPDALLGNRYMIFPRRAPLHTPELNQSKTINNLFYISLPRAAQQLVFAATKP